MTNKEKYKQLVKALIASGYNVSQHTYTDAGLTYYYIAVTAPPRPIVDVVKEALALATPLFPHAHEITINGLHSICLYEQDDREYVAAAAAAVAAAEQLHAGRCTYG